ncbi:MAG: OmpH family outer membrane protein [Pseudomonadota bacterium]
MKVLQVILLSCFWVIASNAAIAEHKIAFVNQQVLLEKAPQAEAARNNLQKEFAKRDKALVKLQKKIKSNEKKLQKDAAVMSNTALSKLKRKITLLRRDLERDKDAFREDLSIRQNEELVTLQKVVLQAITKVAQQQKYDLIVSDGVIYASKRIDVTSKILKELNKKYKAKK